MKSAQAPSGSSREKKMTIFPHLWCLIPRCLCIQSVLFIANTQAVYFFSVGLLPTISVWFTNIYIAMCIYLQPYMIIKVCMPNEIYPNSFSFFFFGGLGGGGRGGEEEEVGALKLFALTQYCTKLFQVTLKQITILSRKITILSVSAIFTGPIATMR